jgi:dephospho-CoA kinase
MAGKVDRAKLATWVLDHPEALRRLEALIHPLVREAETRFLAAAAARGAKIAVLEIPLLFETGADQRVDATVVVSAPGDIQRSRASGPE